MLRYVQEVPPFGWAAPALALIGVLIYTFKGLRFLVRLLKNTMTFLEDWQGEPARPGVPARLGILERVARIEGELKTNGGASLKDQTNRIEGSLRQLSTQFAAHVKASGDHYNG